LKQSIEALWRDLETAPSTVIEKELANDDAESSFKLSSHNIEALRDLNLEVSLFFPLKAKKKLQSGQCL